MCNVLPPKPVPGGITGPPCSWGPVPPDWASLESETVPRVPDPRKTAMERTSSNSKRQTQPLVRVDVT